MKIIIILIVTLVLQKPAFAQMPIRGRCGDGVCGPTTSQMRLLKKVEIANGARPEIIVAQDKVFVVYLEVLTSGRSFKLKIYDKDLNRELAAKTLVTASPSCGSPTDIRVISDGMYLYAFYETATMEKTCLFGAKYTLDDNFERVAYTDVIATSTMFKIAKPGDEKLDDTPSVIEGDNIYVMTRYKSTIKKEGETRYKLYKFDKDLHKESEFELDLSEYADGEAKQASIIYENGYYYIVLPTTVGASNNVVETVEWTVPMDILLVKLDKNWNVVSSKIIASEGEYSEGYVTGLKSDEKHFYLTYGQVILSQGMYSVLKVFDKDWNAVLTEKYKAGHNLRPSLEISPGRIYAGNNIAEGRGVGQGTTKAEIYVFEGNIK